MIGIATCKQAQWKAEIWKLGSLNSPQQPIKKPFMEIPVIVSFIGGQAQLSKICEKSIRTHDAMDILLRIVSAYPTESWCFHSPTGQEVFLGI